MNKVVTEVGGKIITKGRKLVPKNQFQGPTLKLDPESSSRIWQQKIEINRDLKQISELEQDLVDFSSNMTRAEQNTVREKIKELTESVKAALDNIRKIKMERYQEQKLETLMNGVTK